MKIKTYLILFFLFIEYSTIYARWATHADAPVAYEFYNRDVNVEGSSTEDVTEYQLTILSEQGREQFGTTHIYFNGDTEKLELIEAKTIHNGVEHSDIITETKPLASSVGGFDTTFQLVIAYPKAVVGVRCTPKNRTLALRE